jgi:hypothetical protein
VDKYKGIGYIPEIAIKKADEEFLKMKKKGRPSQLPEDIALKHIDLLKASCRTGSCINNITVITLAHAVTEGTPYEDMEFTEAWSRSLLRRLGMVSRKALLNFI